jgi:hypothetical protein
MCAELSNLAFHIWVIPIASLCVDLRAFPPEYQSCNYACDCDPDIILVYNSKIDCSLLLYSQINCKFKF